MRLLIKYIIILSLFVSTNIKAQDEITPELKQRYIQILSDSASYDQFYVLAAVIDSNIVEAKSAIEQNFWKYSRLYQTYALKALLKLHSDLTLEYAHRLIDTLDTNPHDFVLYHGEAGPDVLYEKVEISNVMFELNDFSQPNFVFELIDRDSIEKVSGIVIQPLIKIKNVPSDSAKAKNKLKDLAYHSEDQITRLNALIALEEATGKEALPVILHSFQSDSSDANKYYILNKFLGKYSGGFDLEELLRERLYSEPDGSLRLRMAKILLYGLGGISNYNFVKNYASGEPDEMIKDLIDFEVKEKVPRLFDEGESLNTIIDSLVSMNNQAHINSWIGDLNFKDELQSILQSAKENLLNGDSLLSAQNIKIFQNKINEVYIDSLNQDSRFVTFEGWKFLYNEAQFILNRLPSIPEETGFGIKLINSSGSLITGGSLKYYEGGWKDAVDNGDGTFSINTDKQTVSLRMTYEYGAQTISNVPAQSNTYTFQTVNTKVELQNSQGTLLDEGTVKYYAGAWRDFGTTVGGVVSKELLPGNYSFRMTYQH